MGWLFSHHHIIGSKSGMQKNFYCVGREDFADFRLAGLREAKSKETNPLFRFINYSLIYVFVISIQYIR